MTWLWLAPCLIAAVVAAYVVGFRRGARPVREERRQQEIAALLVGEDPKNLPAAEERAVIHQPVIESSHSWSEGNNEEF